MGDAAEDLERRLDEGRAAHRAGRLKQAQAIYRAVLDAEPGHAEALHLLGVLLHQAGRHESAAGLIGEAIAAAPERAAYHGNLGTVLRHQGHRDEALAAYRRAVELAPDDADAHHNLGTILQDLDRTAEAEASYRRALALDPAAAETHRNLAMLLQAAGRLAEARAAAEAAVRLAPDDPDAETNLAGILLQSGEPAAAMDAYQRVLAVRPWAVRALAGKAIALAENGDPAAARALADLEGLVVAAPAVPGGGYADTAALNRDLAAAILADPSLQESPPDHATRHGWHTAANLLARDDPAIAALRRAIEGAVQARIAALPADPAHPFVANRPAGWRLTGWAVVMRREGHQGGHIHPAAWLSGVYYVQIPPHTGSEGSPHAGWIEFGRADAALYRSSAPEVRLIQPREGLIVTFPSYFWHRTIPVESDTRRICVAFDVVPVRTA